MSHKEDVVPKRKKLKFKQLKLILCQCNNGDKIDPESPLAVKLALSLKHDGRIDYILKDPDAIKDVQYSCFDMSNFALWDANTDLSNIHQYILRFELGE